jgi:ribonuclease HII
MADNNTASPIKSWAFWLSLGAFIGTLFIAAMVFNTPKVPTYGVIDLKAVTEKREADFAALLTKPNVTDQDRAAAYDLVKQFAAHLDAAVKATREECKCTLMVKAAVISPDLNTMPDYTDRVRKHLADASVTK